MLQNCETLRGALVHAHFSSVTVMEFSTRMVSDITLSSFWLIPFRHPHFKCRCGNDIQNKFYQSWNDWRVELCWDSPVIWSFRSWVTGPSILLLRRVPERFTVAPTCYGQAALQPRSKLATSHAGHQSNCIQPFCCFILFDLVWYKKKTLMFSWGTARKLFISKAGTLALGTNSVEALEKYVRKNCHFYHGHGSEI